MEHQPKHGDTILSQNRALLGQFTGVVARCGHPHCNQPAYEVQWEDDEIGTTMFVCSAMIEEIGIGQYHVVIAGESAANLNKGLAVVRQQTTNLLAALDYLRSRGWTFQDDTTYMFGKRCIPPTKTGMMNLRLAMQTQLAEDTHRLFSTPQEIRIGDTTMQGQGEPWSTERC